MIAPPALADNTTPEQTSDTVARAVEHALSDTEPTNPTTVRTDIPLDPNADLLMTPLQNGESMAIRLPEGLELSPGVQADQDTVVYKGEQGSPDVVVAGLTEGSRVTTVIK